MSRILSSVGVAVLCMLGAHSAHAAVLYPYSNEPTVGNNGSATVELRLDSQGKVVNAVEATVTYDTNSLRLVGIDTNGSALSVWAEPPVERPSGMITFSGGIPNGAVVVGGRLITMSFNVIGLGETTLRVSEDRSGVYLDDGSGTKDALRVDDLTLSVLSEAFGPLVLSPTMPIESRWYPSSTFTAQWTVYPASIASYMISPDAYVEPDNVPEANLGTMTFPNLADGIWYFTLKEQFTLEVWGAVTRRTVRIDTKPPEPFEVSVLQDGMQSYVTYVATDATSGISKYLMTIERHRLLLPWRKVLESRSGNGPIVLKDLKSISRITILAVDAAGNERASTWRSPRFEDGTRVLVLIALSLIVGLSGILYLIVTASPGRRRKFPVR